MIRWKAYTVLALALMASPCWSADPVMRTCKVDLPASTDVIDTFLRFYQQCHITVIGYAPPGEKTVERTHAVRGTYRPSVALALILVDMNLNVKFAPAEDGEAAALVRR